MTEFFFLFFFWYGTMKTVNKSIDREMAEKIKSTILCVWKIVWLQIKIRTSKGER